MASNLIETVNVDYYSDVEVTFDYEDGNYFIKKVVDCQSYVEVELEGWLVREVVWALKCNRKYAK